MNNLLLNILSVKNEKNYKIFDIFGLKLKIKQQADLFLTINSIWKTNGATEELTGMLSLMETSPYLWKRENNKIWLIFLSCLVERGYEERARELLDKYIFYHGVKDIDRYILPACFSVRNGIVDENIKKACFIFEKLSEQRKNKIFENLISNKSVAIVGNGPSELGKNKGEEIDSHDIVIRFNNYRIDNYEKDYGTKTNIWIKCSSNDIVHNRNNKNFDCILYEPDYYHHEIIDGYLNVLFDDCKINVVDYFDFDDHYSLRKQFHIFPTSGFVCINKVIKQPNIKHFDLYGFSFLQEKQEEYSSHYFNDRSKKEAVFHSSHHNLNLESEFIKRILNDKYKNC